METLVYDYQLFSDNSFIPPDYSEPEDFSPAADRRNLLLWEPRLEITGINPVKISFYTSDAPGEYQVTIRGFEPDNSNVYGESSFTIR